MSVKIYIIMHNGHHDGECTWPKQLASKTTIMSTQWDMVYKLVSIFLQIIPSLKCLLLQQFQANKFLKYSISNLNKVLEKCNWMAKSLSRDNYGLQNKFYQHFLWTHFHILIGILGEDAVNYPYLQALPRFDLTNHVYWPKEVLAEVDSKAIIEEYTNWFAFNSAIAKEFVDFEYTKYNKDEWAWAFNI